MDANLTTLGYAAESAFAETPDQGSTLQLVRFTGESLRHRKDTVISEEIRADRQRGDIIQVGRGAEGSIDTEWILGAYNDWLLGALLASAWSAGSDAVTANATAATNTITATSGTFSATTQAAKLVRISGFVTGANNGIRRVISCSSTVMVVASIDSADDPVTADETGVSVTVVSRYARNGVTPTSFLIEKGLTGLDTPRFNALVGMLINQLTLTLQARSKAMATWDWMGAFLLDATSSHGDGSPTAESVRDIINTSSNLGTIILDGSALSVNPTGFNLSLNNNLRERGRLQRLHTLNHGKGTVDVTGSFSVYFEDATILTKFLQHTSFDIFIPQRDSDGNCLSIHIPNGFITDDGNPMAGGINTDIILNGQFAANEDPSLGYTIQIDQLDPS